MNAVSVPTESALSSAAAPGAVASGALREVYVSATGPSPTGLGRTAGALASSATGPPCRLLNWLLAKVGEATPLANAAVAARELWTGQLMFESPMFQSIQTTALTRGKSVGSV